MAALGRYVITGAPGAGKSSVLDLLRALQYPCCEEVSRRLIMEEVGMGSQCLPWTDLACFAAKALDRMETDFRQAAAGERPAFFDRGIPDIAAYLLAAGLPIPDPLEKACRTSRYGSPVFILPPWKEIYVNDPERWQTYPEAVALHDALVSTYQHYGYALQVVPHAPVVQRAAFILRTLSPEGPALDPAS